MPTPFEAFKKRGPQQEPLTISFSETTPASSGSSNEGFPYDLDKTGNIGKERFKERIQRKLKERLPDIIGQVPIDGSGDGDVIHVHLPPERRPIFQRGGRGGKGYGQGEGEPGDVVAPGPNGQGQRGKAGHDQEGDGGYDVQVTAEDILAMVFKDWELPDLEEKKVGEMTEDNVQWDDIRKAGPFSLLHRKQTIIQNIKRRALEQYHLPPEERKPVKFGDVKNEDLRFHTYSVTEKPITQAVIFAMRDVSGSIGEDEAYAAKVMLSWAVRFLRTQYSTVKIVFGIHHSSAKVGEKDGITEEIFFNPRESGGTDFKPAVDAMVKEIDTNYPKDEWNVYPFYVGDGEIFERPEDPDLKAKMAGLLDRSRRLFYAETSIRDERAMQWYQGRTSELMQLIEKMDDPRIIHAKVNNRPDMKKALDHFFKKKSGGEGEKRL